MKRLVASGRERVDTARAAVEARRPRVRSVDATLSAYERDRDRAGFLLAGALAYRLFLWLLPFTLVIVAGLGFLEASDHDNPSDLADNLGVVGLASKSVSEAAADAEHTRFIALLIGIPVLYLASLAVMKALTDRFPIRADFDVAAFGALFGAATNYLLIRGRGIRVFQGVDLGKPSGWARGPRCAINGTAFTAILAGRTTASIPSPALPRW